jgi:hypothetical protein
LFFWASVREVMWLTVRCECCSAFLTSQHALRFVGNSCCRSKYYWAGVTARVLSFLHECFGMDTPLHGVSILRNVLQLLAYKRGPKLELKSCATFLPGTCSCNGANQHMFIRACMAVVSQICITLVGWLAFMGNSCQAAAQGQVAVWLRTHSRGSRIWA